MEASGKIKSPITASDRVVIDRILPSRFIIEGYLAHFSIDVSDYFKNLPEITIYKCLDTGYRYYHPFHLEGKSKFYESLFRNTKNNYYMDWRWEHTQVLKLLRQEDSVLEIGCGKGIFLERLRKKNISCAGLELNKEALTICAQKNLQVKGMLLEEFLQSENRKFDVICAFQTLEHIAHVREFIMSAIEILRPGGRLIISVPNNDSWLQFDEENWLNLPPHHMGLWNEDSLRSIERIFPLTLQDLYHEPLQNYHIGPYYRVIIGRRINNYFRSVGGLLNRILFLPVCFWFFLIRRYIKSFTVIAEYKVND
jgi:SAM-dependent methyltransferase